MTNTLNSEMRCARSSNIDQLPTADILRVINDEDKLVPIAVEKVIDDITVAVDSIYAQMKNGGRLIYVGAGTSGRLGVLDASECPPTYGTPPDLVIGRIAGGFDALTNAIEGAEDDADAGRRLIDELNVTPSDSVIGICASGKTPYVVSALLRAKELGALTVALVNNAGTPMHEAADISIAPIVGAEVITGSTRMKSGTAQKLVLNMISTSLMIKLGKVYGNLMVDMKATNNKLKERAVHIVSQAANVSETRAHELLALGGDVKTAIIMEKTHASRDNAQLALKDSSGVLRAAIEAANGLRKK